MYQVLPNLYVSDFASVMNSDKQFFQVNCAVELPDVCDRFVHVPLCDADEPQFRPEWSHDFRASLPHVLPKIHSELKHGRKVVVHCYAGRQRSCAMVAAYLMWKFRFALADAVEYVKRANPVAFEQGVHYSPTTQ